MRTAALDYELPEDRIAQRPTPQRDGARMLVVRRDGLEHRRVDEWCELVPANALVVLNDTRVLKARLLGRRRGSGGRAEIFLLRRRSAESANVERWDALGRASKALRAGSIIDVDALEVEIVAAPQDGMLRVELRSDRGVGAAVQRVGHVPLPPYVRRPDEPDDVERYQTVFAREPGSVAAPTAGLHVTEGALDRLRQRGVDIRWVTLHVGLGTFRPVSVDNLDEHVMHHEVFHVGADLVARVRAARRRGGSVVAVGTTAVRALEAAADPDGDRCVRACSEETDLFIREGHPFRVVDSLLTNFHLPRSTLLALVSAFAGLDRTLASYRAALEAGYRFLSYGDAMWIPERLT